MSVPSYRAAQFLGCEVVRVAVIGALELLNSQSCERLGQSLNNCSAVVRCWDGGGIHFSRSMGTGIVIIRYSGERKALAKESVACY